MESLNSIGLNSELSDELLDSVSGGVDIGDTVTVTSSMINYCSNCGRLLMNYQATIINELGKLDGNTVYSVRRNCCGAMSRIISSQIKSP